MRLICPNCDAQYEVDAGMIPASGRDVQCSNCGRTWFQEPDGGLPGGVAPAPSAVEDTSAREAEETGAPETEKSGDGLDERAKAFFEGRSYDEPEEAAPVEDEPAAQDAADGWEDEAEADVEREAFEAELEQPDAETMEEPAVAEAEATEVEVVEAAEEEEEGPAVEPSPQDEKPSEADSEDVSEGEPPAPAAAQAAPDEEEWEDDEDAGPPPGGLPRRKPDPSVLGILRAEAEREIAARRAEEAEAMESQPDLGSLDPAPPRPVPEDTEARTARLRGAETPEAEDAERKTMLPDIDDINATLTSTKDRREPELSTLTENQVVARRTGFRIGFSVVMLTVVGLIFLYLYAPQLAEAVPGLEPALAGYVDWANGMRLSLDTVLANTVDRLTGLTDQSSGEG